ncbi:MAG: indole-3-glycerol phosphate synthase [Flavobacteriales bacterium]|nr:MAG: indole-3-glycerol phosphate synthase [Flavobacteriales bacterium]
MTILDTIIAHKYLEIKLRKSEMPVSLLEKSKLFQRDTISFVKRLNQSNTGIIAEYKRRSPSKAEINMVSSILDVATGYEDAGVCGMSVLTDGKFFGGSLDDLQSARGHCNLPILRKEFIIDEYQILAAKAFGADAILLIASVLSRKEIQKFSGFAQSLGLEVLLEVHNQEEIVKSIMPSINMLGVNNRNLNNFEVNLSTSKQLAKKIPDDFVKVSESGISSVEAILDLRQYGFKGFLIGESFMKTDGPGKTAKSFIKSLENKSKTSTNISS